MAIVVVAATVAALAVLHKPARSGNPAAGHGASALAHAAAVRTAAVGWIASQVGQNVVIACDSLVCSSLAAHGFPASNLNVLKPTASDPYGSVLVIATADIRNQFGAKLSAVYAPEVIASFGSGASRIDVRVLAAGGPAVQSSALAADLAGRKSSGAQLLGNSRITVSAAARGLLAAGLVDSRLLTTLAFLAGQQPVDIVGFGSVAPGAAPGVPTRVLYLAEFDPSAHLSASAYVSALENALHRQSPPFVPLVIAAVQLPTGQPALEIEFAAPSPLGLLQS